MLTKQKKSKHKKTSLKIQQQQQQQKTETHLVNIDRGGDFKSVVRLALVIILNNGFFKDVNRTGLLMSN
jgi:hypothetical protein